MRDRLEDFYEQELFFIRRMAAEFARDRPRIADRLYLKPGQQESGDPHVERLIESFAFLAARIQLKLEDEFPELTDALLGLLYPHYLAPIPSRAIAQFEMDPSQGKPTDGYTIKRGSQLRSREVQGLPCRFRTVYPVTLWPVELTTTYLTAPFGSAARLPASTANAKAMLRLELKLDPSLAWKAMNLDDLRVFLFGDDRTTHQLYELIFNHCTGVFVQEPGGAVGSMLPPDRIQEVGFGRDEGLLPYEPRSFLGYRLLTELFAFPQKFLFADIKGLKAVTASATSPRIDICILLDKADPSLESRVDKDTLRLGCTPIINLFDHPAEPIRLTHARTEYHVVPDNRHGRAFEVYSINSITSTNANTGEITEYDPFFACRHGSTKDASATYWYSKRVPSTLKNDPGTETWISLVNLNFDPSRPADEVLSVSTTCSNRDLPEKLETSGGESWGFELEGQSPLKRIVPLILPTSALRVPFGELRWRLISHLALNHLSITDGDAGADTLRELLTLYDYSGSRTVAQQIAGIESVTSRRKTARITEGQTIGFCRGVEIDLSFDPDKYQGTGPYLMASVLEKFVGLYATMNSFTRLRTKMRNSDEPFKVWPYRVGEQTIV